MKPKPKEHDRFTTLNYMSDNGFNQFDLTPSERLIYFVLFRHADKKGHCHVSFSRLANGSGLSVRQCERSIKALATKEVVKVVCKGNRSGTPTHYAIYGRHKKPATSPSACP